MKAAWFEKSGSATDALFAGNAAPEKTRMQTARGHKLIEQGGFNGCVVVNIGG